MPKFSETQRYDYLSKENHQNQTYSDQSHCRGFLQYRINRGSSDPAAIAESVLQTKTQIRHKCSNAKAN